MNCHPLSLSDEQMGLILLAARSIPISWRHRYLSGVADRLTPLDQIADQDVQAAIQIVLERIAGAA